ncbi:MAG TPA: TolC family protein [Planctomycetota bacterium]|jgi:outer membrane protein TolC|nr:TolC family protein [Planctomycetota bacterium]
MRNLLARLGTSAIPILCAGCIAYHAAPIEPARMEDEFARRTLADPALAAWVAGEVVPAPSFPPPTWSLSTLCLAAFWFHPDLDVARAQARTARAGVTTASTPPNPTFAFRPEYVLNPAAGDSRWVADLGLDFLVETADKRDLRTERAHKLALAAEVGVYEAAWHVRNGVRTALLEHLSALHELNLLRLEQEPRREVLDLLRRRLAAGEAARLEVARAEIEVSRIDIEVRTAETRIATSRAALAAAIGVPESAMESLTFEVLGRGNPGRWGIGEPPAELPLDAAREPGLLERFDVRRALLEYDAAEADVRLEVAKQVPDLTLGPGYVFDQGLRKLAFNFALPLPLLDRNRGPIAEAEARRSEAQARFTALQARAIGEIEGALAAYRGALAELAEARLLSERQRTTEEGLRHSLAAGAADRLDVAVARAEVAALARVELLVLHRAEEALGDLENALERPLEGSAPVPDSLPVRVEP